MEAFVRNLWYVAGWSHDVPPGQIVPRVIAGEPIALYRRSDGSLVALADQCPHRQAPLSMGRLEGDDLRCMYHGLKFAPSGKCLQIPGQARIPASAKVKTYAVAERNSWIWVWLAEPGAADERRIPRSIGLEDRAWSLRPQTIEYAANYQLINDNLTDFSHLAFVHEKTIGRGSKHAESQSEVHEIDQGIVISRWHESVPSTFPNSAESLTDTWTYYSYLAPGIMYKVRALHPVGTADRLAHAAPPEDLEPLYASMNCHAVTPVDATSSRYLFSIGPRRRDDLGGEISQRMFDLANQAFLEDKVMIEAQQRGLQRFPPPPRPITIAHDKGPVLMRRAIERLIGAEALINTAGNQRLELETRLSQTDGSD
jgi:phenylpropionate dioxygenase-like ring-hydroxylating dioxygenase large terminal subunit